MAVTLPLAGIRNRSTGSWAGRALVVVIGLVFALPLLDLLRQNLAAPGRVPAMLAERSTLAPLWRTVVLCLLVGATTAVIGTTLALLTHRTDLPGRRVWRILAPLPMVVPSFVGATALLAGVGEGGLLDTIAGWFGVEALPRPQGLWGAWLVLALFTYPFVYLPVVARIRALPASLEESARMLGRSRSAVLREVLVPQLAPAVAAGALLSVLYTLSDVGAVDRMRYSTLARELFITRLDQTRWLPLALVLAVLALTLTSVERLGHRRLTVTTTGGRRAPTIRLGAWRWPALGLVAFVTVNALMGPTAVLVHWLLRALTTDSTTTTFELDLPALVEPLTNTVLVSVIAAAAAVLVVLPLARLSRRDRERRGRVGLAPTVAGVLVVAGYALPGLVVALSLVVWVLGSDLTAGLYQTLTLLVLAYVIHFGAQAARASQIAVDAVPGRLTDAARMLGAGRVRRFVEVEARLMAPGLFAGAGLVLLSVMKELPATLLLAPIGFRTLSTTIWEAYEFGSLAQTSLVSIVLLLASAALTWLLVLRRMEHT